MREYTIILDPDDEGQGYTVTVPALHGCITQGRTVEECVERAKEAIQSQIEAMIACGDPVPEEKVPPQTIRVQVAA